jgi:2'-5' RNA ligase
MKYTESGAEGMPAHITILFPMFSHEQWNEDSLNLLIESVAPFKPFTFNLTGLNRFQDNNVLFLQPDPVDDIINLTHSVMNAFPHLPPYNGDIPIDDIKPHVTIAITETTEELDTIEKQFTREISPHLPIEVNAKELWFVVKEKEQWLCHSRMGIGGN